MRTHAHPRAREARGMTPIPLGSAGWLPVVFRVIARAREAGFSRVKKLAQLASRLFEQVLDPSRHLSDLPDTDPVRTVELFHRVCHRRVNPVRTVRAERPAPDHATRVAPGAESALAT